jgi:hypothetical protein
MEGKFEPGGQGLQESAPVTFEKVPGSHSVHPSPEVFPYLPKCEYKPRI